MKVAASEQAQINSNIGLKIIIDQTIKTLLILETSEKGEKQPFHSNNKT